MAKSKRSSKYSSKGPITPPPIGNHPAVRTHCRRKRLPTNGTLIFRRKITSFYLRFPAEIRQHIIAYIFGHVLAPSQDNTNIWMPVPQSECFFISSPLLGKPYGPKTTLAFEPWWSDTGCCVARLLDEDTTNLALRGTLASADVAEVLAVRKRHTRHVSRQARRLRERDLREGKRAPFDTAPYELADDEWDELESDGWEDIGAWMYLAEYWYVHEHWALTQEWKAERAEDERWRVTLEEYMRTAPIIRGSFSEGTTGLLDFWDMTEGSSPDGYIAK